MTGWHRARLALRRRPWRWARWCAGAVILAVLVLRLGAGPFLDGVRRLSPASLTAAVGITAVTTLVSAWRWQLIARALGVPIPLGEAVASYYRSQFLNSTLPGGVLGDVHRGVRHGEEVDDVSRGLRSVGWDRAAGQVVQVVLAAVTLLALASPVRPAMVVVVGVGLVAVVVAVVVVGLVLVADPGGGGPAWPARVARTVRGDVRAVLSTPRVAPAIVVASAVVVVGHVGVFLVAAKSGGSPASISQLLPLTVLVLLSMTVPTSIAGWGPREGVAAWAFAAAGLGADRGVATATAYGVLSLVAVLPGAVVLVVARRSRRRPVIGWPVDAEPAGVLVASAPGASGRAHG